MTTNTYETTRLRSLGPQIKFFMRILINSLEISFTHFRNPIKHDLINNPSANCVSIPGKQFFKPLNKSNTIQIGLLLLLLLFLGLVPLSKTILTPVTITYN